VAVVTLIEFKLLIPEVAEASGDQPEKWANTLNANASIINDRRNAKLPDSATFNSKVAVPSAQGFSPMVDAEFVSRKGRNAEEIIETQAQKIGKSFDKYTANLDYAFETVDDIPAKRFQDANNVKKTNWALGVADTTLRMTGDRIRGLSVSAICPYLLTADARVLGMLREGDVIISGAPIDVSLDGMANAYRVALTQMLTRAGLAIYRSGYLAARFTAQNLLVEAAANAFLDVAKADKFDNTGGAASTLKFIFEEGLFKLHGKVTKTAA
jgi:hypothetical protein